MDDPNVLKIGVTLVEARGGSPPDAVTAFGVRVTLQRVRGRRVRLTIERDGGPTGGQRDKEVDGRELSTLDCPQR